MGHAWPGLACGVRIADNRRRSTCVSKCDTHDCWSTKRPPACPEKLRRNSFAFFISSRKLRPLFALSSPCFHQIILSLPLPLLFLFLSRTSRQVPSQLLEASASFLKTPPLQLPSELVSLALLKRLLHSILSPIKSEDVYGFDAPRLAGSRIDRLWACCRYCRSRCKRCWWVETVHNNKFLKWRVDGILRSLFRWSGIRPNCGHA